MKFVLERLLKFYRLPPGERLTLVQAWEFFLLAELCLWVLPFNRLLSLADTLFASRRGETRRESAPSVARIAWLVEVAGRYVPGNITCLKKALVLSWLLGRRGIATTLRIGVAREEGRLKAHAWLEQDGRVIIDDASTHGYQPLLPMA